MPVTGLPEARSGGFRFGIIYTLVVNAAALTCMLSILGFGFFGVGLSSGTADELRQIWSSFKLLAFCCQGVFNLLLLAYLAYESSRRKDAQVWLGWLAGTAITLLPTICLAVIASLIG